MMSECKYDTAVLFLKLVNEKINIHSCFILLLLSVLCFFFSVFFTLFFNELLDY